MSVQGSAHKSAETCARESFNRLDSDVAGDRKNFSLRTATSK